MAGSEWAIEQIFENVDFFKLIGRNRAALRAVTGFDDWAPRRLAEAPPDQLRAHLAAAVHDLLRLPAAPTGAGAGGGAPVDLDSVTERATVPLR